MKKITKSVFFNSFIKNNDFLDANGCVEKVSNDDIIEFKIGNKYFYKLIDDSYLRSVHEYLCYNLLDLIPVNNSAVAYRKGLSYFNLFEPHTNGYYFLRLDISSFFHSIQCELLRECFSSYFDDDCFGEDIDEDEDEDRQTLLDGFIALATYEVPDTSPNERFRGKVVLPIGFKTSPVISNIVFRKLDILIQKYCASKNIVYSRYADDMLFSSSGNSKYLHSESFFNEIKYIISIDGFKINKRKTIRAEHTISLNGYILSNKDASYNSAYIRISNKKTKIIEKLLYMLNNGESNEDILSKLFGFKILAKNFNYFPPKKEYLQKYCKSQVQNKITGYRSFLISVLKFDEKYKCVNISALKKYICLIESLNQYIK